MPQSLGVAVELPLSFEPAVTRVREALKHEGCGVLPSRGLNLRSRKWRRLPGHRDDIEGCVLARMVLSFFAGPGGRVRYFSADRTI